MDENESVEQAACRELHEETGYFGIITFTSSISFNDPGLTDANTVFVKMEIDLNDSRNLDPTPNFQDEENIKSCWVKLGKLLQYLENEQKLGKAIDARLYTFALGHKI